MLLSRATNHLSRKTREVRTRQRRILLHMNCGSDPQLAAGSMGSWAGEAPPACSPNRPRGRAVSSELPLKAGTSQQILPLHGEGGRAQLMRV